MPILLMSLKNDTEKEIIEILKNELAKTKDKRLAFQRRDFMVSVFGYTREQVFDSHWEKGMASVYAKITDILETLYFKKLILKEYLGRVIYYYWKEP